LNKKIIIDFILFKVLKKKKRKKKWNKNLRLHFYVRNVSKIINKEQDK
jgi:hypothetical protein